MEEKQCADCHLPVMAAFNFCPNCGKQLKENNLPIKMRTQLGLYALSILIAPFGLLVGIQYILRKNRHAKRVGIIIIILSIVTSIFYAWSLKQTFDHLLEQMRLYQGV